MNELELQILSCLLLKPELMGNNKLEDKYFKTHQKLWQFMKAFYSKFKTFDTLLMISVASNQYKMADYITLLFDYEPAPSNFDKYLNRLIEIYNQDKKEKWIILKTYELANSLFVGEINLQQFEKKYNYIKEQANKKEWK